MLILGTAHVALGATWEAHTDAGLEAYQRADYAEAEKRFRAAVRKAEALGPQDPRLATSLNNLAGLYQAQGRYAEAEPLHQRALAIREKALGPEHPDVAQSLNNLAALYQAQGRYADAEPPYQRSLAIVEKALGPEHPNVATALENYAELLRETGRNAEADRLEARAKVIRAARSGLRPVTQAGGVEPEPPAPAPKAESLDELLERVRRGSSQEHNENRQREKENSAE